jgi:hypothetical protein
VPTRRDFLKTSALAGALAASGQLPLRAHRGALHQQLSVEGWADRPMRWANLTFVDNDPIDVDLDWWMDFYKRNHFDGLVLSIGGYIAYYPSKVPFHYVSPWLKGRDLIAETIDRARAQGMAVIGRVDPHAVRQELADAHPDWLRRDEEGKPYSHWIMPELFITCAFGPMNWTFMPQIIEEIMTNYKIDGLFANRWNGSGMCYCEHCARQFREATGFELPRSHRSEPASPGSDGIDWHLQTDNPAARAYVHWRRQKLLDLWDHWDAIVRRHNPHARFIPNMGPGLRKILDMSQFGERSIYLTADRQGRQFTQPPWMIGMAAKEFHAVLDGKPLGAGFSFGPYGRYRWMDSTHGRPEIAIWTVDAIANGIRPSIGKTGARIYDTRWMPVVERLFGWHHRHERYLRNTESLARIGMVYSQDTFVFASEHYEDHQNGMYQALLEARQPFDMVHANRLDLERIRRYRLLVLPNIVVLDDRQCQQLREFVAAGGSILATHETSLRGAEGRQRSDFGLADLFGATRTGATEGPTRNSFMNLHWNDPAAHPILSGFEDAKVIVNPVRRVPTAPTAPLDATPLTLMPGYPSLPMEELYPRVEDSGEPLLYLRRYGAGRVAFLPVDIERSFWELLLEDHARLLANVVAWALNEPPPVVAEGGGFIDLTYWRQKASLAVHVVNLSNAMTMRGHYREFNRLGPQRLAIQLPADVRAVRRIRLLVEGSEHPVELRDGRLWVTIPGIDDHEVVGIDL